MIIKKIILSESTDKTGLFDEYYCVSNTLKGTVKSGLKRSYQRTNAGKKYFGILNKWIYHLKILAIIELPLSLPATNEDVGKVFALVNALWTGDTNWLEVSTVKSGVLVMHHFAQISWVSLTKS
jgi:hypothetical protein